MSHLCRCICHLATKKREEQAPDFNIDFEVKSKWQTWNKIKKDCKEKTKQNKIAHLLFIITSLNLTVYKTDAVKRELSQLDGREKKTANLRDKRDNNFVWNKFSPSLPRSRF